jgi:hypothetical protein
MYSEAKRLPTQMKMISEEKLKRYRCKRSEEKKCVKIIFISVKEITTILYIQTGEDIYRLVPAIQSFSVLF